MEDLVINDGLTIPAIRLEWSAVRASGAGGQNVNKVATKVDLRFDLEATTGLDAATKLRLRELVGERGLDATGRVIVTSQATRHRERNLEDARAKLRELIARALVRPTRRKPTRPTAGSKRRRLEDKRHQARKKEGRGRAGGDD